MLKSWERTQLTSLDSVKVPKNELKTNSKLTQNCAENSAITTQNAGWRIPAGVFCRHLRTLLESTREWAPMSRQRCRDLRHPIFINFRRPEADGDRGAERCRRHPRGGTRSHKLSELRDGKVFLKLFQAGGSAGTKSNSIVQRS